MAKIKIDKEKCKGCFLCISVCPKGKIKKAPRLNKRGFNYVGFENSEGCIGCSMCALICPDCCIEVYK